MFSSTPEHVEYIYSELRHDADKYRLAQTARGRHRPESRQLMRLPRLIHRRRHTPASV